jgi:5-(hydroxymethyl)furfural/furfural oxidase
LQDHPLVGIGVHLRPDARLKPSILNSFLMYTRFSSGLEGCPAHDMKMSLGNRFDQTPVGHQFAAIRVGPDKAYSRGLVRLRSRGPDEEPIVAFNLLSDCRDMQRMVEGIRFAYRVLMTEPVPQTCYSVFAGVYTDWIRRLSSKSIPSRLATALGAFLLDLGQLPRDSLMRMVKSPDFDIHTMIDNDEAVRAFAAAAVLGNWHACGTCRMGALDDRMACVDSAGRVHGVEGLRVVDASLMPSIPCANIHLTTIMIAEKISDDILEGRAGN